MEPATPTQLAVGQREVSQPAQLAEPEPAVLREQYAASAEAVAAETLALVPVVLAEMVDTQVEAQVVVVEQQAERPEQAEPERVGHALS